MELLVNKLISSLIQIIIFTVIPFIWWLITARKKQKFNEWIGLKAPIGGTKTAFSIIGVSVAFLILGAYSLYIVSGIETATSDFRGLGTAAIPAILVNAVLNTSFPEEIIRFRK